MVTRTYIPTPFSVQSYNFIRSVIRHRKLLITENKSTVNTMKALRIIEQLSRNNNKNYTDEAARKFFRENSDDIRYLIRDNDIEKLNKFNHLHFISKV